MIFLAWFFCLATVFIGGILGTQVYEFLLLLCFLDDNVL